MTRRRKTQFHEEKEMDDKRTWSRANETPEVHGDTMRRSKVSLGGSSVVMIISSSPGLLKRKKEKGKGWFLLATEEPTKITGCIKGPLLKTYTTHYPGITSKT